MNVTEIFLSIDGEVNILGQGTISTFIRLAGCNLDCSYCDTPLKDSPGRKMTISEIMTKVNELKSQKITITGGEPLLQKKETLALIDKLVSCGKIVSIETNGTKGIPKPYLNKSFVSWVIDYKLDYERLMNWPTFKKAGTSNYVKILVSNRHQLTRAMMVIRELRNNGCEARIAISPVIGKSQHVSAQDIIDALVENGSLDVMLNIQLHKYVNVA